jgi:hypothetical protein
MIDFYFLSDHFGGGYVEQMASPVSQQQWSPFAKQQPSPHQHMEMSPMLSSTTPTDELTSMSPISQQQAQQQQQPTTSYNQKTSERMKQDEGSLRPWRQKCKLTKLLSLQCSAKWRPFLRYSTPTSTIPN